MCRPLFFPTGYHINLNFKINPLEGAVMHPNISMQSNPLLSQCWESICHTIPAFCLDLLLRLTGHKPW